MCAAQPKHFMSMSSDIARSGTAGDLPAPYRRLSLKRNILWTGIGTAVYYVAQYALMSLVAKLTNSASVGQFSLGLAVTTPIIVFSQMQFRSLQVTDVKSEFSFPDYFWTRVYGTALALLIIVFMGLVGDYAPDTRAVILLLGVAKGFESLSDLTYGTLQSGDRMDYVAISQSIKSVLTILLFGGALLVTQQLLPAVILLGGVWALVFFGFDLPFARKVSGTQRLFVFPSRDKIHQLVVLSLPLAVAATMNAYLLNLPRYDLKPFGEKSVGHFSAVASLVSMVTLITGTVSQATQARVATYYQTGDYRAFFRLAGKTALLHFGTCLALTLGVLIGGEKLVGAMFTAEYRPYTPVLLLMCAGMTINSLNAVGSITLTAGRKFRHQFVYTVALLVLCLPLYQTLIARHGVIGAGWAEFGKFVIGGILMNLVAFPFMRDLWRKCRTPKE